MSIVLFDTDIILYMFSGRAENWDSSVSSQPYYRSRPNMQARGGFFEGAYCGGSIRRKCARCNCLRIRLVFYYGDFDGRTVCKWKPVGADSDTADLSGVIIDVELSINERSFLGAVNFSNIIVAAVRMASAIRSEEPNCPFSTLSRMAFSVIPWRCSPA